MTRRTVVVKVGGNEIDDPAWVSELASAISLLGARTVVVHGGGKEVSALQRTLGIEPEWSDGLRVTSAAAMGAVAMVLSGAVNKRLTAALVDAGVDACGISGEDGALIRARTVHGGALGRVGQVVSVRRELLELWLDAGIVPVVSPVSRGEDGRALNVNADDVATAIAATLGADELLFVSNVAGVLEHGTALTQVDAERVDALVAAGMVAGGMVPKLRGALRAAADVVTVRIGGLAMLGDTRSGTRVRGEPITQVTGTGAGR